MRRVWTKEKDNLLRRHYPKGDLKDLAKRLGVTVFSLKDRAVVLGIHRKVRPRRPWTERQIAYLRKHYATMSAEEIAPKVGHSAVCIYKRAESMGLKKHPDFLQERGRLSAEHPKAVANRFAKGHEPRNKGKRLEEFMSSESIERLKLTQFKPGQLPHNTKPVGYERVDKKDGYVYMKVSMDRMMVLKHRYIWEQAHGEIPEGFCIAFRDGNRMNCQLDNLYLISRGDLARKRVKDETSEQRARRVAKGQETRNKSIRRDKIRIHWGLEPLGKLVKRW